MKQLHVDKVEMEALLKELSIGRGYDVHACIVDYMMDNMLHNECTDDEENPSELFAAGFKAAQQGIDTITVVEEAMEGPMFSGEIVWTFMPGSSEKLLRDLSAHLKTIDEESKGC